MFVTTRGIVLHTLKYSDSSIIAKIYTEIFGIQSYIVSGVRSPKSKTKVGLFQPLSLLDLVVYHKNTAGLQRIKELKISHPLHSTYSNFHKNAIALFIAEVLYKSLHEETPNPLLFEFLAQSILSLETEEKQISNFHIYFLANYTEHLGFYPQIPQPFFTSFFDLKHGGFTSSLPNHSYFLPKETSKLLYDIFTTSNLSSNIQLLSVSERRILIHALLHYYELHLPSFHDVKSHLVFEQLAG